MIRTFFFFKQLEVGGLSSIRIRFGGSLFAYVLFELKNKFFYSLFVVHLQNLCPCRRLPTGKAMYVQKKTGEIYYKTGINLPKRYLQELKLILNLLKANGI